MTALPVVRGEEPQSLGMRTLVEVVARRGPGGRTVLPVVRATGQLAVRRTGESRIHLVSKAFGPLGGDAAVIRLYVEAGARLEVCSVAAAVCLPARARDPSTTELHAEVAPGGRLDVLLEPTIVAAGAEHHTRTVLSLAGDARLRVTERVVLGRHGEEPGRWTGTTRVERDGTPLLHTTIELGPGSPMWRSPMWRAPTSPRSYATDLMLDTETAAASRTGLDAVLLPLPGGWVIAAWGERLDEVLVGIDRLSGKDTPRN